jgi:tripartite-type tricarboxylate transporter receptor subunit TctC
VDDLETSVVDLPLGGGKGGIGKTLNALCCAVYYLKNNDNAGVNVSDLNYTNPDLFNRILSKGLEKYLKVPVVTVNKPGGAGAIGFSALVNARPDGYTIGVGTVENMIIPTFTEGKPPYSLDDLYVLGQIATIYNVLVVAADAPWKTWWEFVDYAKKNPGKLRVSTTGVGSLPHFMLEMIQVMTGTQFTHVPLKGSPW